MDTENFGAQELCFEVKLIEGYLFKLLFVIIIVIIQTFWFITVNIK